MSETPIPYRESLLSGKRNYLKGMQGTDIREDLNVRRDC